MWFIIMIISAFSTVKMVSFSFPIFNLSEGLTCPVP